MAARSRRGIDHDSVEDVALLVGQDVLQDAHALAVGAHDIDALIHVQEGSRLPIGRHEIDGTRQACEALVG
jgi:hypothetical protein